LQGLKQSGVGAIYLGRAATPFDVNGEQGNALGQVRASGLFLGEDGHAGSVQQLDLFA
jgi:hypothetical protein